MRKRTETRMHEHTQTRTRSKYVDIAGTYVGEGPLPEHLVVSARDVEWPVRPRGPPFVAFHVAFESAAKRGGGRGVTDVFFFLFLVVGLSTRLLICLLSISSVVYACICLFI